MDALLAQCEALLGRHNVLTGDDVRNRAAGIWRSDGIAAKAILRPGSTEELSAILKACHAAGQIVVPQGGLTNLVESADAHAHDVAISLERMHAIEAIDPIGRTATVQAGARLQAVQAAADEHGLMLTLDLGARGSCTIGGNLSTNAGGNRVLRYGMARDQVLGLEAVLADGTVISSLNRMLKNNSGYDLKHLFIGSEGTLGIITRAVLRLREQPGSQNTALVALHSFTGIAPLLKRLDRELGGTLSAFEVMWRSFYELMTTAPARNAAPLGKQHPIYVLIDALGAEQDADRARLELVLERAAKDDLITDAVLAKSQAERAAIWAIRDDVEQMMRFKPIFNFDVSMPLAEMEQYVIRLHAAVNARWPENRTFTFGHLADGNLHCTIAVGDDGPETRRAVERLVYEPLTAIGGSVSAEHGIGLEKKPYLHLCRKPAEIELMRTLKRALDPKGILNPGKIFDGASEPNR